MSTLSSLTPLDLHQRLGRGDITLIDVRGTDEFAREHTEGSRSIPLPRILAGEKIDVTGDVVFQCRTGMRTSLNSDLLASSAAGPAFVLEGGIDAWKGAGLAVVTNRKAPLEIMRQVQIAAGSLVLAGACLSATVDPAFIWLSGLIGGGLVFAGASGWCGMARLLARAPWNRQTALT